MLAGVCPRVEHLKGASLRKALWPYSQTLDLYGTKGTNTLAYLATM